MLTGKAYSRALRGHLPAASSLLALILEPYLENFHEEDLNRSKALSFSNDNQEVENDSVISTLVQWFEVENLNLRIKSRIAALWLSYIEYYAIIQDFIQAERTNSVSSVCRFRQPIECSIFYAATGHNNYAKSCRLHFQSALALEYDLQELPELVSSSCLEIILY